jgi:hypothetical protein
MSPTTEQIRLPQGTRLERRPTVQPSGNDELPAVRTRDGRVLALVDALRPDWGVN